MSQFSLPPGAQRSRELVQRVFELREAVDALSLINSDALHPICSRLQSKARTILAPDYPDPTRQIGNHLSHLLSVARGVEILPLDSDGMSWPSFKIAQNAVGLVMFRAELARSAAARIGLTASEPSLGQSDNSWYVHASSGTDTASAEDPSLHVDLSTIQITRAELGNRKVEALELRLDKSIKSLNDLIHTNGQSIREQYLTSAYVEKMMPELALFLSEIEEQHIDFDALSRTSEITEEMTGDFIATVRAWVGVPSGYLTVSERILTLIRRVVGGVRTLLGWALRNRRKAALHIDPPTVVRDDMLTGPDPCH